MKIKGIIVLVIAVSMLLGSCAKNAIQSSKIKSDRDSLSYAFGVYYYSTLNSEDTIDLDPVLIAKAMLDGKAQSSEMTEEEARTIIMAFISKRDAEMAEQQAKEQEKQAEANKVLFKDYITENETFLAQNKEKEGVQVTATGLQYKVIKMGTGEKPTAESTVRVHYTGSTIDGNEFDTSRKGEPVEFPLANVIAGWTEALQLMPVGSRFMVWLPSELAYGPNGAGDAIKPFSTLVFDVELIGIIK
jgi:FKBP-type peptidyl-prolyl cis-trans isomerase FklB